MCSVRALLVLRAVTVAAVVLLAAPADRAMAQTGSEPVNIPDPVLQGALETALGKTAGEAITCPELETWSRGSSLNFTRTAADDRDNPGGAVRDLTGLECATRLDRLYLQYNRVSDLTPLAGLLDLTVLDLRNNRIRDITPLRGLIYLLRTLYLDNNRISDLSPLGRIYSLVSLTLAGNRISDLSPLARLAGRNLTDLTLSDNDITDLSPLRGLTSLQYLHLYRNRITDLSPLQGMTALKILSLSGNQRLSDLRPLSGINSLTNLHLESTSIDDLKPLVDIAGLGSGDVVNIRDNQQLNDPTNPKAADNADHVTALRGRGVNVVANLGTDRTIRNLQATPGEREGWLKVTWNPVPGASGYRVYWRSGWEALSSRVTPPRHHNTGSGTTTSYVIEDLTPGTEYSVAAATYPPFGVLSGEVSCHAPAAPPDQVTGVAVTRGVKSLVVSWDPVTGADGYRVRWKSGEQDYDRAARQSPPSTTTPDPCGPRRSDGMRTTSYTIDASIVPGGLTPGTVYTVRVIATKDHADDGEPSREAPGTPRLPAPTGVAVTPDAKSLGVSWNRVAGASGYTVQWKSDGQDSYPENPQEEVGADTTSHTIEDLTPDTGYTVRVIATTDNAPEGNSNPSDPSPGMTLLPVVPTTTSVRVTEDVENLGVSWNRVADADGYTVQWKSDGQDDYPENQQEEVDADTTSHTIEDLTPGTEYTVRVTATTDNARGRLVGDDTGTPSAPPPAKVTGVVATPGVESLVVSWNPVTGASGYKVQWRSDGQDGYPENQQEKVGADPTSHTIEDLTLGTKYTVRVIATKDYADDGEPSDPATGTPRLPPPAKVTGVTVTPGVESLVVSWNPVTDAGGYKVQWRSDGQDGYPENQQEKVGADPTSHTIEDLTPGTEYTVRVIATKDYADDGEPSDPATGVPGRRVGVSVADAAGVEGAAVAFPVRLTEPSIAVVTLAWTTEGGGTAQAGEDYRAVAAGSLTLQPGDTAGTLRVSTLDDGRVEPAETFRVRLTDATNAAVDPRAGSATGTIEDDDTEAARGRALRMVLAGMGRTIAADAVDVVGERFTRPPAEAQVAVGGLALTRGAGAPGGPMAGAAPPWEGAGPDGIVGGAEADGWTSWTPGEGFRRASAMEWLSRSSFELPLSPRDAAGSADGGGLSLWGRGTAGRFDGTPEAGFRMDGDVLGGYVGLDYRPERDTVLGMAVAHTRGDADYEEDAVTAGAVDLALTSVLPYARWKPRPELGVWGLLGVGWGEVELEDEAGRVETDVEMLTAAFGLRQEVATWRGIDVAFQADTFLVELEAEAREGLPKTAGDARRLRLRLEGRKEWELSAVSRIEPSLDVGGRWDGGDAESGLGVEVGGGLAYVHTGLGLEVDARGRYLLAHRQSAFDERGGSVTVRLDPGQAGRGPWLTFAPGWGAQGSRIGQMWDGAEVLRSSRSTGGRPGVSPDRLDLDMGYGLGYGFARGGAGLLTPYAGLSMAEPRARAWKVGARLEVDDRLDLRLEGRHSVRADGDAGNEVVIYGSVRW